MLISLTGPSGIGKGYVRQAVLQQFPYIKELPWITTRPLRPDELQGRSNRISVERSVFESLQATGELTLVQMLHGHQYGLLRSYLAIQSAEVYLTEFQMTNLEKVRKDNVPLQAIGLLPSDLGFLRTRLVEYRGSESPTEVERRITLAEEEIITMQQHRSIFSLLITVSGENEGNVTTKVLEFLTPVLEKRILP